MSPIIRILFLAGLGLILLSGVLLILAKLGIPLGRLPGDIHIQTDKFSCAIPLATSIILSILLTILLNLFVRLLNK